MFSSATSTRMTPTTIARRHSSIGSKAQGTRVLLDVLVGETVSVLCRRARQRRASPPDLEAALVRIARWHVEGEITSVAVHADRLFGDVLDVVRQSAGILNFNDGLLVVLQHEGVIDELASFDEAFDAVEAFRRIS